MIRQQPQIGRKSPGRYRAARSGRSRKPDDYTAIPYRSAALDPFDSELIADDILWPEGEKDVDSLSNLNLPALVSSSI